MKITAAVTPAPGAPFEIAEIEMDDELRPHEVLVKNVASGICHSDISMRDIPDGTELIPGFDFMPKPIILGHEGAGLVVKVGSAVTNLEVDDHVIMSFDYCGECHACEIDKAPYCDSFLPRNLTGIRNGGGTSVSSEQYPNLKASYHQQSSFANYSLSNDTVCIKVSKDAPLELLGPLGCGFLTGAGAVINRLKPRAGSSFACFGCGPLGFAAMFMAKKAGCEKIIAVDLHASRLEMAREFGATDLVNAGECDSVEKVIELTGKGCDYGYEATGSPKVMSQMIASLGPFGHGVVCGVVNDLDVMAEFSPAWTEAYGKTISGILMGDGNLHGVVSQLAEAVTSGEFPIEKLVTFYDLNDINQAIEDSESGKTIKAILRMPH